MDIDNSKMLINKPDTFKLIKYAVTGYVNKNGTFFDKNILPCLKITLGVFSISIILIIVLVSGFGTTVEILTKYSYRNRDVYLNCNQSNFDKKFDRLVDGTRQLDAYLQYFNISNRNKLVGPYCKYMVREKVCLNEDRMICYDGAGEPNYKHLNLFDNWFVIPFMCVIFWTLLILTFSYIYCMTGVLCRIIYYKTIDLNIICGGNEESYPYKTKKTKKTNKKILDLEIEKHKKIPYICYSFFICSPYNCCCARSQFGSDELKNELKKRCICSVAWWITCPFFIIFTVIFHILCWTGFTYNFIQAECTGKGGICNKYDDITINEKLVTYYNIEMFALAGLLTSIIIICWIIDLSKKCCVYLTTNLSEDIRANYQKDNSDDQKCDL